MIVRTRSNQARRRLSASDGVAVLLVGLFMFLAIAAPSIWGHAADEVSVEAALTGPTAGHLMGTDSLGRDILARTLVATRPSIILALLATTVGAVAGVGLGSLAAVVGRRLSQFLAALINILVAFPALLLAIFFSVILGIGSVGSVLAIGAAFAPGFARLTQTLSASLGNLDFVHASRLLGKSRGHIITRHILPNIGEPLLLYGTVHIGTAILALSGLSFLGFGIQPPQYDWGAMLSQGLVRIYITPSAALAPAVAIVLAGLSFNLIGEKLSDIVAGRGAHSRSRPDQTVRARNLFAPGMPSEKDSVEGQQWILDVEGLQVHYDSPSGPSMPVRDVSIRLEASERVGVVGETGSGKSLTALAIAQLIEAPGRVHARKLHFLDVDLLNQREDAKATLGRRMAIVFQDPGGAFNPAIRVGTQLREPAEVHLGMTTKAAESRAVDALHAVAIPEPARRYRQYQHEFSGGMKQRAAIAMGLMAEPYLLIADEPTTALDVTVQQQILRLIIDVQAKGGASLLLISHDIAVVSEVCDRTLVMYAGFIVEDGNTDTLLTSPAHPYTAALLASSPHMDMSRTEPLHTLGGRVPGPEVVMEGCYFAARCPKVTELCRQQRPPLAPIESGHRVACWHPLGPGESVPNQEDMTFKAMGAGS